MKMKYKIKDFSALRKNPLTHDPRTKSPDYGLPQQEGAWGRRRRGCRWEQYKIMLGKDVLKMFETFRHHKLARDEKYHDWMEAYKKGFTYSRD